MPKIIICNTGTTGMSHARREGEGLTLCGHQAYVANRGESEMPLSEIECRRCQAIIQKECPKLNIMNW